MAIDLDSGGWSSQPTWLFIAGATRSGSTLLGVLAAEATGGVNCGELNFFWRQLKDGGNCQCGMPLTACDVWRAVVDRARGELGPHFDRAVAETIVPPRHGRPAWWPMRFREPGNLEIALRAATERAIESVTGGSVIVDVSKQAVALKAAMRRPHRLVVVHLVRDPRAVVYSWRRPKALGDSGVVLEATAPSVMARRWTLANLHAERVLAARANASPWVDSMRVTYEDLASDPQAALVPILSAVGITPADSGVVRGHGALGNTPLYSREKVSLDTRWIGGLSDRDRLVTTALTAPLMARYGYPLRSPSSPPNTSSQRQEQTVGTPDG